MTSRGRVGGGQRLGDIALGEDAEPQAQVGQRLRHEPAAAAPPGGAKDQPDQELTLETAEFLTSRRRIAPLSLKSEGSATARRLYVPTLIQEGLTEPKLKQQTGGSFKKALAAFTHTKEIAPDIEFVERQAEIFGNESRARRGWPPTA